MIWGTIWRTVVVLTSLAVVAFIIAGVTGNLDPTPQEKAQWAAEAKLQEANDKAQRLEAQHEAWREHVWDDLKRQLEKSAVNSATVHFSCFGSEELQCERLKTMVIENEEQAHPDAWRSYHP